MAIEAITNIFENGHGGSELLSNNHLNEIEAQIEQARAEALRMQKLAEEYHAESERRKHDAEELLRRQIELEAQLERQNNGLIFLAGLHEGLVAYLASQISVGESAIATGVIDPTLLDPVKGAYEHLREQKETNPYLITGYRLRDAKLAEQRGGSKGELTEVAVARPLEDQPQPKKEETVTEMPIWDSKTGVLSFNGKSISTREGFARALYTRLQINPYGTDDSLLVPRSEIQELASSMGLTGGVSGNIAMINGYANKVLGVSFIRTITNRTGTFYYLDIRRSQADRPSNNPDLKNNTHQDDNALEEIKVKVKGDSYVTFTSQKHALAGAVIINALKTGVPCSRFEIGCAVKQINPDTVRSYDRSGLSALGGVYVESLTPVFVENGYKIVSLVEKPTPQRPQKYTLAITSKIENVVYKKLQLSESDLYIILQELKGSSSLGQKLDEIYESISSQNIEISDERLFDAIENFIKYMLSSSKEEVEDEYLSHLNLWFTQNHMVFSDTFYKLYYSKLNNLRDGDRKNELLANLRRLNSKYSPKVKKVKETTVEDQLPEIMQLDSNILATLNEITANVMLLPIPDIGVTLSQLANDNPEFISMKNRQLIRTCAVLGGIKLAEGNVEFSTRFTQEEIILLIYFLKSKIRTQIAEKNLILDLKGLVASTISDYKDSIQES